MWNWIQEEFYKLLIVLERYPKVWILPCVFFIFCIAVITWLNAQLGHYFETRSVTQMMPYIDQFIVNFYDKIRGKLVNRYLILGSIFLFFIGYLKYRKKCVF
ncbi:hypothetical protein B1201_15575 [Acinetobacter sp. ANC 5600]|nr:hypothetical protein B1201_15575 [Acinetobacter sp. ANC 5600]